MSREPLHPRVFFQHRKRAARLMVTQALYAWEYHYEIAPTEKGQPLKEQPSTVVVAFLESFWAYWHEDAKIARLVHKAQKAFFTPLAQGTISQLASIDSLVHWYMHRHAHGTSLNPVTKALMRLGIYESKTHVPHKLSASMLIHEYVDLGHLLTTAEDTSLIHAILHRAIQYFSLPLQEQNLLLEGSL